MFALLKKLLGRSRPDPAPEDAASKKANPKIERLQELDAVDKVAREVLTEEGEKAAGRVFLITLEPARSRYGKTWAYLGEKARRMARSTIEELTQPQDACLAVGDVDYVLVLRSPAKREVVSTAMRIDQMITLAVTGEDHGQLGVNAKEISLEADGTLKFKLITFMDVQRTKGDDGPVAVNLEDELLDEEDDDGSNFPSAEEIIEGCGFELAAVVDFVRKGIAYVRVTPKSTHFPGSMGEFDLISQIEDPKLRAKLNLRALRFGRRALRNSGSRGAPTSVIIPVEFETLANAYTRNLHVKLAQRIPQALRRNVIFEISDVPFGVAQSRLAEIIGIVRPFGSGIMLRLDPTFKEFRFLADLDVVAVGPTGPFMASPDAEQMCRLARGAGYKTVGYGVQDENDLRTALTWGLDYAAGALFPAPAQPVEESLDAEEVADG